MREVEVAIIGAGTAGLSARGQVAKQTDDYVVIDPGPLGTTCARIGCMPSKVLIQIAQDFHRCRSLTNQGVSGGEKLQINIPEVLAAVRKLRDEFVSGVTEGMESWQDKHLIRKRARFLEPYLLDLEGEKLVARKIIIATGSRPLVPKAWEEFRKYLLTTDEIFECTDLPRKIGVVGMGVIGLELGQALNQLGIEVLAFTRGRALGGLSDPSLQELSAKIVAQQMSVHFSGVKIRGIQNGHLVLESSDRIFEVEKALIAIGRVPNTESLGLKEAGLPCDANGVPEFNKKTFRLGGYSIYFAGDVTGERQVLHEAADEGRIVGYNVVREKDECFSRRTPLSITFSDPEIGIVGERHQDLVKAKTQFVVGEVSFSNQGRSRILGKNQGACRIYGDKRTGRLLGAEMIAPRAEHLAHLLAWAVAMNMTAQQVLNMPFYHPVVEEGVRTALRELARQTEGVRSELEVMRCQEPPVEQL